MDVPAVPREGTPGDMPPQVDPSMVRSVAFSLKEGQASDFIPTREGGIVLLVESFVPVQEEELKAELPQYLQQLRRESASRAFNSWFSKELQMADLRLAGDDELEQ